MDDVVAQLKRHVGKLYRCRQCSNMIPPVVSGNPIASKVLLVGQAPGVKEGIAGRPFAWTAGKTLFNWFGKIGLTEEEFRSRVYMAAVCRCFPGKGEKGGDRVPSPDEIFACSRWLDAEIDILQPELILPVGKLAIAQFMDVATLAEVVGRKFKITRGEHSIDIIPLPHPSGASTWHRTSPGKELLGQALTLVEKHKSFARLKRGLA